MFRSTTHLRGVISGVRPEADTETRSLGSALTGSGGGWGWWLGRKEEEEEVEEMDMDMVVVERLLP